VAERTEQTVLFPDDNSSIPSETPPEIPSSTDNTPIVAPEQPVHRTVSVTGQNLSVQLTSSINTCPRTQLRSPLATIANNHQVTSSSSNLKDRQLNRKGYFLHSDWLRTCYFIPNNAKNEIDREKGENFSANLKLEMIDS